MACSPKSNTNTSSGDKVERIVIGMQPNEKIKDVEPFRQELEKRLGGIKVNIQIPTEYSQLVDLFKRGEIDFAFFTALNFIEAERDAGAKALLKKVYDGKEFYYSSIVVRADSKIKKISDLKGKKIGFVDPKSTSGYLYPRVMLRAAGLDSGLGVAPGPTTLAYDFFGNHENSVQALLDKKVDAIGVWGDEPKSNRGAWTAKTFAALPPNTFRVLTVSDPIPNDAFAVREVFFSKHPLEVFKVMEALIGMSDDPNHVLKIAFDVERMATATSRHYDGVRALESLVKETKK